MGGLLSFPILLRIWDLFLFYGWDVLCLVSIALLDYYQTRITRMDPATILYFLGAVPIYDGIPINSLPSLENPDKFMENLHDLSFKGKRNLFSFHSKPELENAHSLSLSELKVFSGFELVTIFRRRYQKRVG